MDTPVKHSLGRRARKALETRRRVLDAADTLFTRDGYAATTMAAIADQADVAVQTLYAVFGNKRTILTELIDARVVGDDHAESLQDREDWQAMERETDPHRQIALFAQIATRIATRSAAINEILAAAAGADSEIAVIYDQQRQARYKDERRIARSLARKETLRPGLSETRPPTSSGRSRPPAPTAPLSANDTGPPTNTNTGSQTYSTALYWPKRPDSPPPRAADLETILHAGGGWVILILFG